jgi:hypothetical protein
MAEPNQDDRWRELYDLLGVPGESAAPASSSPQRRPEQTEPPRHEAAPPLKEHHELEEPEASGLDEPLAEFEDDLDDAGLDEDTVIDAPGLSEEQPIESDEGVLEEGPGEGEGSGDEDKPRRGRRRRRRGRRRSGDKAEEEGQDRPPVKAAEGPRSRPSDTGSDRGPQRRRGRRDDEEAPQRRPAPMQHPEPDEQPAGWEGAAARGHDVELAAEDTDFSDWNVPSWQELISSLYRPDR